MEQLDADRTKARAQFHCDYCRRDVSNTTRIRCAVCVDFDLCLECFSVGVEVFPHKNDHDYRVIDHVTKPIFDEEWGADEELLLLEAIEMYGLGNWSDIADHVGTKNRTKCEQHYYDTYLNSKTAPLPELDKPLLNRETRTGPNSVGSMVAVETGNSNSNNNSNNNNTNNNNNTVNANANAAADIVSDTKKSAAIKPKTGSLAHLVGYIPNRGDFDVEYENDAEHLIADMEFKLDDTPYERDLKLSVLQIYNSKLDNRVERKQFIIERGLLDPPQSNESKKKRTKEEKEIENNMRVFARFHTKEEHEQFVNGLISELRLRRRIEQLQNYRINGIRTLDDGNLYDADRRSREDRTSSYASAASSNKRKSSGSESRVGTSSVKKSKLNLGGAAAGDGGESKTDKGMELIISQDGFDLLSIRERSLCAALRLLPRHYLMLKDTITRRCFAEGFVNHAKYSQMFSIDIHRIGKVMDFFVSCGWINESEARPPSNDQSEQQQQQQQQQL